MDSLPLNIRQSPSIDSSNVVLRLTYLKLSHSDVMEGVPKFSFLVSFMSL